MRSILSLQSLIVETALDSDEPPLLSAVIPCLNEENRLGRIIRELKSATNCYGISCEIIVVDDGSTDNTSRLASELGCRVVRHPVNRGIAAAFRTGASKSQGKFIMMCPVDVSSFEFLKNIKSGTKNCDILSISKRHQNSIVYGYTPTRWLMSNGYHFLVSLLFDIPSTCSDTHYVKIYDNRILARILPECIAGGAVGETELIVRSYRAGAKLMDIAGTVIHKQQQSKTRLKVVLTTLTDLLVLYLSLRKEKVRKKAKLNLAHLRIRRKNASVAPTVPYAEAGHN